MDLRYKEALNTDPKAIHQINFTGRIDSARLITMFFILEEGKETILEFSQGTVRA